MTIGAYSSGDILPGINIFLTTSLSGWFFHHTHLEKIAREGLLRINPSWKGRIMTIYSKLPYEIHSKLGDFQIQ